MCVCVCACESECVVTECKLVVDELLGIIFMYVYIHVHVYVHIECSATKFCNLIGQSVVSKSRRSHESWFLQISRG